MDPGRSVLYVYINNLSPSNVSPPVLGFAGHAYYFLEDVYPRMTGRRPLKTPAAVKALFPVDEPIRPAAAAAMQADMAAAAAAAVAEVAGEGDQQEAAAAAGGEGRPHED